MKLFHRTPSAAQILASGFRDGEGSYMTGHWWRGVFFSDRPLDINEGAKGDELLEIEVPDDVALFYEWQQDGATYREFMMPAAVANQYGPPVLVDEFDEAHIAYVEAIEAETLRKLIDEGTIEP